MNNIITRLTEERDRALARVAELEAERDRYHTALMRVRHVARDEYRDATVEVRKRRWGLVMGYVFVATGGEPGPGTGGS
jgi:hypothetical protein